MIKCDQGTIDIKGKRIDIAVELADLLLSMEKDEPEIYNLAKEIYCKHRRGIKKND